MYPTYEHLHIWLRVLYTFIIYFHKISKQSTLFLFHNILVHVQKIYPSLHKMTPFCMLFPKIVAVEN